MNDGSRYWHLWDVGEPGPYDLTQAVMTALHRASGERVAQRINCARTHGNESRQIYDLRKTPDSVHLRLPTRIPGDLVSLTVAKALIQLNAQLGGFMHTRKLGATRPVLIDAFSDLGGCRFSALDDHKSFVEAKIGASCASFSQITYDDWWIHNKNGVGITASRHRGLFL